jgi:HYR domain
VKRMLFVLLAALLVAVCGVGRAHAAGGTYRVTAGGNQDWGPSSGGIDQTSSDPLSVTGTMTGDDNAVGHADYGLQAGPGIVRARMAGSVTVPSGLFYPFNPSTQAVSTTELTVAGPDGELNISVNVHVDGFLDTPVCGSGTTCGALAVYTSVGPFVRQAEFNTRGETRDNSLGLAFDPVPGGYHVHGDVIGTAFGVRTNTPTPITIVLNLSGRFAGSPALSTFGGNFDDPVRQLQVSFDPAKPVLNDIPAGYTVSGPNVVDNQWTDPFAPPPADVVVTSCAQLAQLTVVHGNLVIRNLAGCPTIAMPNLTRVDGDIIIEGIDAGSIVIGSETSVGGDLTIDGNTVDGAIDVSGTGGDLTIDENSVGGAIDVSGTGGDLTIDENSVGGAIDASGTGGDLTIDGNTVGDAINVGNGQIGGDCTIVDNGDAVVNAGGGVGGDLTIETGGDPFSGTTAGGSTSVTILGAGASMHVVLPAGAFDQPVAFTISRTSDTPPEAGTAADGSPAQIDPILGFRFAFDIPTLNADARLTFTVDLSALDAAERANLLNAIGAGTGTIAVKGDAPDAAFHAFAQCVDSQTPSANGCASVTLLNASGAPAAPNENPAFARFDGVAGHFSSYVVARVLQLDTTPPAITVPANVTVDATGPKGAPVAYSASAKDDHDTSPSLACTPASGTVFPIGDTTVACKATDAAGNTATARFVVHVRGASEQIVRLIDKTVAFLDLPALKPAAKAALQSAADATLARNPRAACLALNVYIAVVQNAPARAFTPAERSELIVDARRIKAVIGC